MNYSIWFKGAFIFQIATGLLHSLSFFVSQTPGNPQEAALLGLMDHYKMDMGNGFHRSMSEIVTSLSACMTMLCLFSGFTNLVLWRHRTESKTLQHIMMINTIVFGAGLAVMIRFAFLPPIVCFALIWVCCFMAYLLLASANKRRA